MEIPAGFVGASSAFVCRLLKSLYGLKQAPKVWNDTLHRKLTDLGFTRIEKYYGLYASQVGGEITMLVTVYVDDLLLIGPADLCASVAETMQQDFQLNNLGEVKYQLGIEITINRANRQVIFFQAQYVRELLFRFHMASCRGAKTPEPSDQQVRELLVRFHMASSRRAKTPEPSGQLQVRESAEGEGPSPYRQLLGALGYLLSGTRPDLAHAVRNLGMYLAEFDDTHFELGRHVLRYLKHTTDFGLVMDIGTC
ncbi:hypothetical protein PR003_g4604 [Phytophthora rubi]|uniref:Reverse transcriptase Ty1/copia-type domain-containing protein n=1 Tax=Phytophthora rubi TaxID=129364 RepID=A0A6A4G1I7_9STRA|nr:hypothetical protein PR001_g4417 [Phytophthora rubi]KAE9352024.1 hypothetical protein PR003_g4604 [Phytophthora rubi]